VKELGDLATSLLDRDGSCRDVSFEGGSWLGVDAVLRSLKESFRNASATDQEGDAILEPFPAALISVTQCGGHAHVILGEGSGLLRQLQIWVWCETDGSPFVEITFFPDDVRPGSNLKHEFLLWANDLQVRLGAQRYYVRYENASWAFGNTQQGSGVFLVSDDLTTDA
jgi:hypothetical protein